VPLQLKEVAVAAKHLTEPRHGLSSLLGLATLQQRGHLSRQAGGQADQAFGMLGKQVFVYARSVVEAVEVSARHEFHEVLVARLVLGEEQEMIGMAVDLGLLVRHPARSLIDLAAEQRPDPGLARSAVELDHAVHLPVISKSQRVHAGLQRAVAQIAEPSRAVQQRVLRVHMKMDERRHRSSSRIHRTIYTRREAHRPSSPAPT